MCLALEKLLCPVEGHNIGHRVVVILKTVALQLWSGIIMVLFLLKKKKGNYLIYAVTVFSMV